MSGRVDRVVPPAPRPTRRTIYGLAAVADVSARVARAALEDGLAAVPDRDRARIASGARAIGIELFAERDECTQRAYRDAPAVDEDES